MPLLLFAAYTTSQYLQVGAVAIVSLLTYEAVTKLVAPQAAAVAALKVAASAATKAASASRLNATLAATDVSATAAYNVASVALIQTQIDTASLLAFFVGIFSFGIGFLKLGCAPYGTHRVRLQLGRGLTRRMCPTQFHHGFNGPGSD